MASGTVPQAILDERNCFVKPRFVEKKGAAKTLHHACLLVKATISTKKRLKIAISGNWWERGRLQKNLNQRRDPGKRGEWG